MPRLRVRTFALIIGVAMSVAAVWCTREHTVPSEFFRQLSNTDTSPDVLLKSIKARHNGN